MRNIIFNHTKKISVTEAESLIERYYDGLTSVDDENRIREFLSEPNLPEQFEPEKAIFGYFENQKQKKRFTLRPYIKWMSTAAAAVIIIAAVLFHHGENKTAFAYVNGKKITNVQIIQSLAQASLGEITSENNEIEKEIQRIQGNEAVDNQINVFSGINF